MFYPKVRSPIGGGSMNRWGPWPLTVSGITTALLWVGLRATDAIGAPLFSLKARASDRFGASFQPSMINVSLSFGLRRGFLVCGTDIECNAKFGI